MAATLNARLEARVNPDIYELLKRAAELEGRSLSDYVISAAYSAAQKTIADNTLIHLSVTDQMAFAEALIHPPKPNEALKEAFRAHQSLIRE